MQDKMKKLMEKKQDGKELDPTYKDAKMSMLQALRDEMNGMMKDDLQGHSMKKVEVAASDKAGLKHGLEKAQEIIGDSDGPEGEDVSGVKSPDMYDVSPEMEEEASESGQEESSEDEGSEGLSEEEQAELERLMAKAKMKR